MKSEKARGGRRRGNKDGMLRDDDLFPMAVRMNAQIDDLVGDGDHVDVGDIRYPNNDVDDVWGSAPASPVLGGEGRGGNLEHSDIPRLKEKHETEGYRDGVTKGKAESVQKGFDEGYTLGAMLGLRIGKILGLLEGILHGISADPSEEKEEFEKLLRKAKDELSTKGVFAREYWGEDGVWNFDVPEEEGKEITFEDVSKAHPLVKKWEAVTEADAARWGVDLSIMDRELDDNAEEASLMEAGKGATASKKAADEPAAPPGKIMGISKSDLNW